MLHSAEDCTNGVPDATDEKDLWRIRKECYIAHLRTVSADVLMASACDKFHNLRSTLREMKNGEAVFERLSVPKDKTIWNYDTLVTIFETRKTPYAREMCEIMTALK